MFHIYGLVDPTTRLVRYVGQTKRSPELRYRAHAGGHVKTTGDWVRSLHSPPVLVLLESGVNRRVKVKRMGHGTPRDVFASTATCAEVKWIKRFRRNLINKLTREVCGVEWDRLINPLNPEA